MNDPLPDPDSAPELFQGVLTRRTIAYFIDVTIMSVMVTFIIVAGVVMGIVTLGVSWLALVFVVPLSIVLYYAVTLGSSRRATIGMNIMDIVLTPTRSRPLDGWRAFSHPLVFWLTLWILPPVSLLVALFTPRRQLLHDLLLGTLMVRRSPMQRHWAKYTS